MSPPARPQRHAPCWCGSSRPLAECCLPWEEAFQHLAARLVPFAATPRIRRMESRAAAIFTTRETPPGPAKGQSAGADLRFLEWFLQDYSTRRADGPLLGDFADTAVGLSPREKELLLASLLAPLRAYEVTEVLGPHGALVKDLLTGGESPVGPVGLFDPPIRSDILICRLVSCGRCMRVGLSLLRLPAGGREEMLAYVRTAYQMARPARHVSLEDFLDGSAHLYHHFFLDRGKHLGGRAYETLRRVTFAPGRMIYRGTDVARILAVLDRQSELERREGTGEEIRYAWIDLECGIVRATLSLRPGEVALCAETREDLLQGQGFLEACLRGLIQPATDRADDAESSPPQAESVSAARRPRGATFIARILEGWADRASPRLYDQTPRVACTTRNGRRQVGEILQTLERGFARQKRLGRAWADVTPVRETLHLLEASSPGVAS